MRRYVFASVMVLVSCGVGPAMAQPDDCPSNLTHLWKLNETTGPLFADSIGNADANCADCPVPVLSLMGRAQMFDGVNDEVSVTDDGTLDWSATASFSISYWMKTSASFSQINVIVGREDTNSGLRWWLGCDNDGSVRFQLRSSSGDGPYIGGTGGSLNDGQWHFIVGVRDESVDRVRVYIDGELADSATYDFTADFASDVDLTIGYLDLGGHYRHTGIVDELAIFDEALTDEEIEQFYTDGKYGLSYCDEGNLAPTIISSPVTDATVERPYTYDVKASGYPAPDFTLTTAPVGMTIDPYTGLVEWTPVFGDEGFHDVELSASNTAGSDFQGFSIEVIGQAPPEITVWYGWDQVFGLPGSPQRAVDVLGNANDLDGVASVVYSLNGAPDSTLSVGPDGRRLESSGDFNIEIATADLLQGTNEIVITATDNLANASTDTMHLEYSAGNVWPLPYAIQWDSVTGIQDAAQIVDGLWELTTGGVRTTTTGYNRLIAIGDTTWTDYEIVVPVTFHYMNSSTRIGLLLRWHGHTDDPISDWQPKSGWFPLGAMMRCKETGLDIYGNNGTILDNTYRPLSTGVLYMLKARVETIPGEGSLYKLKIWEAGLPEPERWDLSARADVSDPANGSIMLLAHKGDVSFGTVTINELMIDDIIVDRAETEATVMWTTTEPATSSVSYGLSDGYEIDTVSASEYVTSHSIILTDLSQSTLYHFQVTSVTSDDRVYSTLDMTFQTTTSSGIVSDDFNADSLNTSLWTFVNPLDDATVELVGIHTEDAWASISVPAASPHRVWAGGNDSPRLMQAANDTDFEIEIGFESAVSERYQLQGVFVEQDPDNLIRFEFYHDGSQTHVYAATYNNLTGTTRVNDAISDGAPIYMRIKREGDLWTQSYSYDNDTWTSAVSFGHAMTVTAVGPYAGNSGSTPPAFTGLIDYFFNTESPILPEDIASPKITSAPVSDGILDQSYSYDVNAIGNPMPSYSLHTFPPGMTIDAGTGLIEWTPQALGDVNVTVGASNYLGADTQSYSINVTTDSDLDGVSDDLDNCPAAYNPTQADSDADGVGDTCDNCPAVGNAGQLNSDTDGLGDACDNCPNTENDNQADADSDSHGDLCDNCPDSANSLQEDEDEDGVGNVCDNCLMAGNPLQEDNDSDLVGDSCDACPGYDDHADIDEDEVPDGCDNCLMVHNPDQADGNLDGLGDACTNTEKGSDVAVEPSPFVTVTFDSVANAGWTDFVVDSVGPNPPPGFSVVPNSPPEYYYISTSAVYVGSISVCIDYTESQVAGSEVNLTLQHFVDSSWNDVTGSLDTTGNVICGVTELLSPFIIAFGGTCCVGSTGNVDGDHEDIVDIGDLTALIDYLFITFTVPECMEEANVDGSVVGVVDIGDLTALIDYLFISFTPPADCQ